MKKAMKKERGQMKTNKITSDVNSVAANIQLPHTWLRNVHMFPFMFPDCLLLDDASTYEGEDDFRLIWTRP
jgi:hypothetical protein